MSTECELEKLVTDAVELMNANASNNDIATVELIDNIVEGDDTLTTPADIAKYWLSLDSEHRNVFEETFKIITKSDFEDYIKTFIGHAKSA